MGEEAVFLTFKTDGKMLEENCPRAEFKRSHECIEDATEAESPNKKLAIENISRVESKETSEIKASLEFVVDTIEVEDANKEPTSECSNVEDSSIVESKCLDKCAFDSIELKTPNEKLAADLSSNETSLRLELNHLHECFVDTTESLNKRPTGESKCSNECVVNAIEGENPASESTNDVKSSRCVIDATEAEISNKNPSMEFYDGSSGIESKCLNECVVDAIQVQTPNEEPTIVSLNGEGPSSVELKYPNECVVDTTEASMEVYDGSSGLESRIVSSNGERPSRVELRCPNESAVDAFEVETPDKISSKESSNDSKSEVLNLNVSPCENASSSQTVSSQPVEEPMRSGCGDIASSSVGDSSTEITDKEEHCVNNMSSSLIKSEVILEGPKFPSGCGPRRLIIKFSKTKNINDGVSSTVDEVDNGFSYDCLPENSVNPSEMKMLKKDRLETYTKNVKKLLSTGVLEGVEVKYINQEKELLRGIIKGCGYLCGCVSCNFDMVLNAYEFEHHAGCKTKHPNDHVFLTNGKSIYSIVQKLKNTPSRSLEGRLRSLVGPLFNEKSYLEWKESFETENYQKKDKNAGKVKQLHLNLVDFPQSTMSCSSEDTEDSLSSASRSMVQMFPVKQHISMVQDTSIERKQAFKKLPTSLNTAGGHVKNRLKKRDNDLHRALFMPHGLPDGTKLAYCVKGQSVLNGYKQGNGILCSCCGEEISPSQFEAHAGWAPKRQPYRHIYTSNGDSLHDLSLSLANGQRLDISNNVDMCTVCGVGGDLILCNACSQAYHAACVELEYIPEDEWRCPYCEDKSAVSRKVISRVSSGGVRPTTIRLTRVVKPPASEIGGCVVCRVPDFSVLKFDDRTVMLCDQCEKEYHVGCLRKRGLCDLKELPKGKWFCCEDCSKIHATLQDLVIHGAKVIPSSISNTINRKHIESGLSTEVGDDVQWQLLSGKFGSLGHQSLISRAVTVFRDSFDPIVEKSGRDLIPDMVYGRKVAGQEFGGMYCAVLRVKSVVVSAGLLRIFGREVAELPLVATTKECRGKGYFQALFSCIERLLCFLNVEKLVLPAAEKAESIWTQKFGFRKMPEDQFQKYTKDMQLISFKGTLMLEKAVSPSQ